MGDDVWRLVQEAFLRGTIDLRIVDTLIVLIPKTDQPTHLKSFRPITLCNVIYKIVTKVMINRLRPFLKEIVGPLQGSFTPSIGTMDNIIVTQEVMNYMHNSKCKKGVIAFKLDLEKAYDSISWNFLETTL